MANFNQTNTRQRAEAGISLIDERLMPNAVDGTERRLLSSARRLLVVAQRSQPSTSAAAKIRAAQWRMRLAREYRAGVFVVARWYVAVFLNGELATD